MLTPQQSVNAAIQNAFLNYFLMLMKDYEVYLLSSACDSLDEWLSERENVESFDKVGW